MRGGRRVGVWRRRASCPQVPSGGEEMLELFVELVVSLSLWL